MKVIVTGALGHIGSKLVREVAKTHPGAEIIMIDDLSTQRFASLFDLPRTSKFRFVESDVTKMDIAPYLSGVDAVIHLAAITNATESFANKDRVETINFNATRNVAKACATNETPLVYVSSTSVYGTQKNIVDENCSEDELQPQSPYAETKLREERLVQELGKTDGLKYTICRFGTIFGVSPGMRFHTAVNKFCWQAVRGEAVTVWRTALHQVRPYLDLEDAVAALQFIVKGRHFYNEIYNVLTLNATVDQILSTIRERVSELKVRYVDTQIMNQLSYHVSTKKFLEMGFSYKGDLKRGISETLSLLQQCYTLTEETGHEDSIKQSA